MNIYQKLKESGYMTDGLLSPLKIDPPKDKLTERREKKTVSFDAERREKSDAMDVIRSGLAGNVAPKKAPRAYYDGSKTYPNTHGLYSGPTRPLSSKKAATMTHEKRKL